MVTKSHLRVIVSTGDPAQDLRNLADHVACGEQLDKEKHVAILLHCADLVDEMARDMDFPPRFPNKPKPSCDSYCKE